MVCIQCFAEMKNIIPIENTTYLFKKLIRSISSLIKFSIHQQGSNSTRKWLGSAKFYLNVQILRLHEFAKGVNNNLLSRKGIACDGGLEMIFVPAIFFEGGMNIFVGPYCLQHLSGSFHDTGMERSAVFPAKKLVILIWQNDFSVPYMVRFVLS